MVKDVGDILEVVGCGGFGMWCVGIVCVGWVW